ncbi:hypothetical protein K2X33_03880 [bacterium]|nr:hypothetical protein [bacterium]
MRRNCPKPESLLEVLSIPTEMGRLNRWKVQAHTLACKPCQQKMANLRQTWNSYFQPEPEIATSLLRVYSRLQQDETLVLKGWKLGEFRSPRISPARLFMRSWGFPTGIAVALGISAVIFSPAFQAQEESLLAEAQPTRTLPRAAVRVREGNAVRVQYAQPKLLHSVEFETVSTQ